MAIAKAVMSLVLASTYIATGASPKASIAATILRMGRTRNLSRSDTLLTTPNARVERRWHPGLSLVVYGSRGRSMRLLDRTASALDRPGDSTASTISTRAPIPALVRTMCQCHHSSRSCAQCASGDSAFIVITTALIC